MPRCYVGDDAATARGFSDGWFKTGDVVIIDQSGYINVIDRTKELIKYNGLQGRHSQVCADALS